MAEIFCLNCKETVVFGENCQCFSNEHNVGEYPIPTLAEFHQENVEEKDGHLSNSIDDFSKLHSEFHQENVEEKDVTWSNSIEDFSKLHSEFQQMNIADKKTMIPKGMGNNMEITSISELNRHREFESCTNETGIHRLFQNQYDHLNSAADNLNNEYYSEEPSFQGLSNYCETDFNSDKKFRNNYKREQISTLVFHQENRCKTDNSISTHQTPNKECEIPWEKNKCPTLSLQNIPNISSYASPLETYLGNVTFSTTLNFSVNTNFCPVNKNTYNNVDEKSEEKDSLNFLEVATQPIEESISLVDKVSESIESMKDKNNVFEPSQSHLDFIASQNTQFDYFSAHGEFASKSQTDNYQSNTRGNTHDPNKCKQNVFNIRSPTKPNKSHSEKTNFVCDICQNNFFSKQQLEQHKLIHTLEKPYRCDLCKKGFNQESPQNIHYRTHNNDKPFACDRCEKRFIWKSALDIHYRRHTGEKPYQCHLCKKAYYEKTHLNAHYKTHVNRPFACDRCEKRFYRSSDLVIHCRKHTGEKPYECHQCKKAYYQKSHLNHHYKTHANDRPFACDRCEKRFYRSCDLAIHCREHTGEKPYECDKCKKGFSKMSNLVAHKRVHTKE